MTTTARLSLRTALALGLAVAAPARATVLEVPADVPTLQAAIDAAGDGDEVHAAPGVYTERIDFRGKAIAVVGSGPASVLDGAGAGPVVTFASGEGPASILDSFTVTGGDAPMGGGVLIVDASPTVRRNVIRENAAAMRGSGIYVEGAGAAPYLHNNLVVYNRHSVADPHAIQVSNASPRIVNNTIVRNDSNGILLAGAGVATVVGNVLAWNGSVVRDFGPRGRGICDFTTGAVVRYNSFFRNRVAALLRGGVDYRRIGVAEETLADPDLAGNLDGNPRLARRRPPRRAEDAVPAMFSPSASIASPLRNAGDPDPAANDADGTRNTIGHTGGPFGVAF
jgi:nitrous oxidase accessory protein NosD